MCCFCVDRGTPTGKKLEANNMFFVVPLKNGWVLEDLFCLFLFDGWSLFR